MFFIFLSEHLDDCIVLCIRYNLEAEPIVSLNNVVLANTVLIAIVL